MKKVKYYYDTENLAFKKLKVKNSTRIGYIFLFLTSAAVFGAMTYFLLLNTPWFDTPKDRMQAREIREMSLQYELLDRKVKDLENVLVAIEDRDNGLYRAYFNSAPIPEEQRKSGLGGVNRYQKFNELNNEELVVNTTKNVDRLSKRLAIQSKSLDEILVLAKEKSKLLTAMPAIQPVRNENLKSMASGYGYRSDPFTKVRKFHHGMDFSAKTGTPVFATGDGKVTRADNRASGYGNHIVINHGFGYETLYAHLSKYNVKPGQLVKRGDIIGFVGNTGRSEAPHLHYEVLSKGQPVNPINYYYGNITAEEFIAISNQANQENQSLD